MTPALIGLFVTIVYTVGTVAGCWGLFEKAGEPGWTAFVPVYNLLVLLRVAGLPQWLIILFFLPCVGWPFFWLVVCDQLALKFGKGLGTSLGLSWLGFVFYPLVGFGPAVYEGRDDDRRRR